MVTYYVGDDKLNVKKSTFKRRPTSEFEVTFLEELSSDFDTPESAPLGEDKTEKRKNVGNSGRSKDYSDANGVEQKA